MLGGAIRHADRAEHTQKQSAPFYVWNRSQSSVLNHRLVSMSLEAWNEKEGQSAISRSRGMAG